MICIPYVCTYISHTSLMYIHIYHIHANACAHTYTVPATNVLHAQASSCDDSRVSMSLCQNEPLWDAYMYSICIYLWDDIYSICIYMWDMYV